MPNQRQQFDTLLELLGQVKDKLEQVPTPGCNYDTGIPLHKAEIHTVLAIGNNAGIKSKELASLMGVTKSAVSQTLNKLVKKGLIRKNPLPSDARESALELTELGWKGFRAHECFHAQIFEAVRRHFGDSFEAKLNTFEVTMKDLDEILSRYEERWKK